MFKRILSKYLLIWLVLVCVLAYFWPNIFGKESLNPFSLNANCMSGLISITMLAVGSLLPYEEVQQVARRWPKTIGGTCVQYIAMPTLAFCVAKLFRLEDAAFIGVMVAGCVPGAMASNVLTLTARGNVSYSVGLTTSATLLSPIVVPLTLCYFLGKTVEFPTLAIMENLLLTVVLPVLLGFTLARIFKWWQKGAEILAEIIANIAIIWIIATVVAKNSAQISQITPALLAAMLALNLGGYLAGYFGGAAIGLDSGMRRALTIEVGMQNAGLGTTIAMKYFPDMPEAALFCASYTFGCMFTGIILAQGFRIYAGWRESKTIAAPENAASEE
ncbi:MAG: bile acid:sodium symporter family protein [Thermoguttaceae bacterium]|nr:bile acid:sodium symporter family protein [Thermoguttaceae bacterium]